ncbi:hypothetical protein PINS_up024049 [Pythium insidiosum]|nr:hypothetical protein PINS_up024049 [Pythium insidiosum]
MCTTSLTPTLTPTLTPDADADADVNVNAGVAVAVAGDDDPSVRVILEYIEAAMERIESTDVLRERMPAWWRLFSKMMTEFEVELHGSEDVAGLFYEYEGCSRTAHCEVWQI